MGNHNRSDSHSADEWEVFRPVIEAFYNRRNMTLDQVRKQMLDNYGFDAT